MAKTPSWQKSLAIAVFASLAVIATACSADPAVIDDVADDAASAVTEPDGGDLDVSTDASSSDAATTANEDSSDASGSTDPSSVSDSDARDPSSPYAGIRLWGFAGQQVAVDELLPLVEAPTNSFRGRDHTVQNANGNARDPLLLVDLPWRALTNTGRDLPKLVATSDWAWAAAAEGIMRVGFDSASVEETIATGDLLEGSEVLSMIGDASAIYVVVASWDDTHIVALDPVTTEEIWRTEQLDTANSWGLKLTMNDNYLSLMHQTPTWGGIDIIDRTTGEIVGLAATTGDVSAGLTDTELLVMDNPRWTRDSQGGTVAGPTMLHRHRLPDGELISSEQIATNFPLIIHGPAVFQNPAPSEGAGITALTPQAQAILDALPVETDAGRIERGHPARMSGVHVGDSYTAVAICCFGVSALDFFIIDNATGQVVLDEAGDFAHELAIAPVGEG